MPLFVFHVDFGLESLVGVFCFHFALCVLRREGSGHKSKLVGVTYKKSYVIPVHGSSSLSVFHVLYRCGSAFDRELFSG